MRKQRNEFYINKKVPFKGRQCKTDQLKTSLNFSHEMIFGEGHHRGHRTGGQYSRKNGELFANTFQGKLVEICLRDEFLRNELDCSSVDLNIYGEGVWDDGDLIVNNKKINVKSMSFFSNLLLLETKDWNNDGGYIPSNGTISDYYIIVRIKPDIKGVLRSKRLFYSDFIEKEEIENIILNQMWEYDLPGFITHDQLVEVIRNKQIIPQNALLNGSTPMDAENYYIESGDMKGFSMLISELR